MDREVIFFGIERTVPAGEKTRFKALMRSTYEHKAPLQPLPSHISRQVEHILGKDVSKYQRTKYGANDFFLVGKTGGSNYSEFHFGAGESSIIRMIGEIENAPVNSLILIEEIENGLHPVATRRMVEYLIDAAERKSLQAIFTTHSDQALAPLPSEGIWACIGNELRQGRLSVESLRAVSGRIEKKLAIFVEDEFAKNWIEAILREELGPDFDQVEVHFLQGDGSAVKTHLGHRANPAVSSKSLCVIDGDSEQVEDADKGVCRLPGAQPELKVFSDVTSKLDTDIAVLTVSCQRPPEAQSAVKAVVQEVEKTNRDPHLIFNQVGLQIGFVAEAIVRGAFLALWVRSNRQFCEDFAKVVRSELGNSKG